jgi:succinate dehydrogenase / fumarate reductase cytochrome b subunit
MFNKAAHFMASMVLIRILEVGLFVGFFIHIIQGLVLTFQNKAKRSIGYAVPLGNKGSKWYSRSMGLLGTIILIFLIIHWSDFWAQARFTDNLTPVTINGVEMHDMYGKMKEVFSSTWRVVLYVIACISLAYHLLHGFLSAFRTLGLQNKKYIILVRSIGVGYSIIVPLAFAAMPIVMYFGWLN